MAEETDTKVYDFREVVTAAAKEECNRFIVESETFKLFIFKSLEEADVEQFWKTVQIGQPMYSFTDRSSTTTSMLQKCFENDSNQVDSVVLKESVSTAAIFKWNVTAGLKLGENVTVETSTPLSVKQEVIKLDIGETRVQTRSSSHTRVMNNKFGIPPRSRVTIAYNVVNEKYRSEFVSRISAPAAYPFKYTADVVEPLVLLHFGGIVGLLGFMLGANVGYKISVSGGLWRGIEGGMHGGVLGGLLGISVFGVVCTVAICSRIKYLEPLLVRNFTISARDVFRRLPGFEEDEEKGMVSCEVRGVFTGIHGVRVDVAKTQENLAITGSQ